MIRSLAVLLALVLGWTGLSFAVTPKTASTSAAPFWKLVVNDQFNSGGVPAHWLRYDGPYGSDPHNCARPDHARVGKGTMRMVMAHRLTGACGTDWYTAGMMLDKKYGSVSQKISMRWRVDNNGARSHRIIPMRWPSPGVWPDDGEEDYCESGRTTGCTTFLHGAEKRDHYYHLVNLNKWHVMTFVRRDYTVRVWIDGKLKWVYQGSEATLPATVKRPVLQQECRQIGCPTHTTGNEIIYFDWIKVWNPSDPLATPPRQ
jgi:hypothetical protein